MKTSAIKSINPSTAVALFIGALAALGCSSTVFAASSFGLSFMDQGFASGSDYQEVQVYDLPQLSYADSFSLTAENGGSSVLSGSISNGALHGYSLISAGSAPFGPDANMDAYFYDTFYIAGPTGESGQFRIDVTFDGSVTGVLGANGVMIDDLALLKNGTYTAPGTFTGGVLYMNKGQGSPFHETQSVILTLSADTSVVLGELLTIRNAYTVGTSVVDNSTAFFTVTPLSSGFSSTSASGLTYTVPEPSCGFLIAGSAVLFAAFRRKLNAPPTRDQRRGRGAGGCPRS